MPYYAIRTSNGAYVANIGPEKKPSYVHLYSPANGDIVIWTDLMSVYNGIVALQQKAEAKENRMPLLHAVAVTRNAAGSWVPVVPEKQVEVATEHVHHEPGSDGWARDTARLAALMRSLDHDYLPKTIAHTVLWEPHRWVMDGLKMAYEEGRKSTTKAEWAKGIV